MLDAETRRDSPGSKALSGQHLLVQRGQRAACERRCIVTGQVGAPEEMIRFVLGPGDEVVPDLEARLPGRGFWLSGQRDMVETAMAKKFFAKAARRGVVIPADLAERVGRLLTRRSLDCLGLARRAGLVVAGYEKVLAVLKAGQGAILLEASDGAAGGRDKICRVGPDLPVSDLFGSAELGMALGREAAVHVLVRPGRMAEVLWREIVRLGRYRGRAVLGSQPEAAEERHS
ncbi:MAG: RNA-binding protein [Alphaproteobacteria bacterium]|nr:RNA-binding protein [Alphaproteobacteria bacterium]